MRFPILAVLIILTLGTTPAAEKVKKQTNHDKPLLPLPEKTRLESAIAEIHKVFANQYAKRSKEARLALAEKLLGLVCRCERH